MLVGKGTIIPEEPVSVNNSSFHEFLEHTGEVKLRVRGGSLTDVFAEAGRALGKLQLRGRKQISVEAWWDIQIEARDRNALLVDWLNELIYRAEAELAVAVDFDVMQVSETSLAARVGAVPVEESPGLVKAATFHELRIEPVADGLEAVVVLDV
jgi:SHS2 domain-containing protein